jgi:hypothetical protein
VWWCRPVISQLRRLRQEGEEEFEANLSYTVRHHQKRRKKRERKEGREGKKEEKEKIREEGRRKRYNIEFYIQ